MADGGNILQLAGRAHFPGHGNDRALPQLTAGQVHEVHGAADDRAAVLAFVLTSIAPGLSSGAQSETSQPGAILCIRGEAPRGGSAAVYGAGLAEMGIAPGRLVFVDAARREADAGPGASGVRLEMLRAGLEAARCAQVAAVVVESWGDFAEYDLTASRRLVLAAEQSYVALVMLRLDAVPRASAAHTRWAVASAPSTPFATAPPEPLAPGPPAIRVELLRRRGGPAGQAWWLTWEGGIGGGRWRDDDGQGSRSDGRSDARPGGGDRSDGHHRPYGAALAGAVAALAEQRTGSV